MRLSVAGIERESVVDGPGIRLAVFVQGCFRNCPGCHNPQTHDPAGGQDMDIADILDIYRQNPLYAGITFSGGEPFLQAEPLAALAGQIHALGGNVLVYTGSTLAELLAPPQIFVPGVADLLGMADILIDGPYMEKLRTLELPFRGSSNQRFLTQKRMRICIGANC